MRTLIVCVLACMLSGFAAVRQQALSASGPTVPHLQDANPTMLRLVIADQWDRGNDMFGGGRNPHPPVWQVGAQRDAKREQQTKALLAAGKLHSGHDFYFAALVMQHSHDADSILLAHVLSVAAVARGDQDGLWLAAASLDRYLQDLKQPQVFGTQSLMRAGKPPTQDPFNRAALTPAERALWNVN